MWLIDSWALCKHVATTPQKTIGVDDIINFERVEAVPIQEVAEKLAELFGAPCFVSPIDEMMESVCADDCEYTHAEKNDVSIATECWRRWIKIYIAEEEDNE